MSALRSRAALIEIAQELQQVEHIGLAGPVKVGPARRRTDRDGRRLADRGAFGVADDDFILANTLDGGIDEGQRGQL